LLSNVLSDVSLSHHHHPRQRNVRFVFNIVARVIPDSVVSAVVRLGVAIILVLSMLLGVISLASLAQQNLQVGRIRR
jgi:hypothetical protein